MNNKQIRNAAFLILAVFAFACASKKESENTADSNEWKEMDEFHMVMAETFHPYKDSANLEPVKARASELAAAAEKWASAPLPEKVDNDEMKSKLGDLETETASLMQIVSGGNDPAISDQLTKVHDLFHGIQEDWYGGEGDDHGHQH